jgi:hypothetical protein
VRSLIIIDLCLQAHRRCIGHRVRKNSFTGRAPWLRSKRCHIPRNTRK